MRRRRGFTLVELLVAMALIVFIMVILSEAFSVGLESFRRLKAVGDMNERLRSTVVALQNDLTMDHFEGKKRVSDPNFWYGGPPRMGFFRIYQGSRALPEGADGDGIASSRATDHVLHFTIKRRGNQLRDFLRARLPGDSPLLRLGNADARYQETGGGVDIYTSQWAEVAYFLAPNNEVAGSTPLYALYRRERLIAPANHELNWVSGTQVPDGRYPEYLQVSCAQTGGNLYFNDPMDITVPERRLGADGVYRRLEDELPQPLPPGVPDVAGADLVLTDVISFELSVLLENGTEFVDLYRDYPPLPTTFSGWDPNVWNNVARFNNGNPRFQGGGPRVFDTWSSVRDETHDYTRWNEPNQTTSLPLYQWTPPQDPSGRRQLPMHIRVVALKVTLRVWDARSQQARQVSLIQDL